MTNEDELLSEARLFQESRVILTAAELDTFTRLEENPTSASDLAEVLRLDTKATARILDCLVTFGLLTKKDGRYFTTDQGALLSSRHPETVRPMVLHLNHMWHNWSHLTETVRQGTNPQRQSATKEGGASLKAFIGAMHVVGSALSQEIAGAYDLSPYHYLLDIGGGSGTYTISFLKQNPRLRAILFDLPEVIAMARQRG